jgi:hypothetical protein
VCGLEKHFSNPQYQVNLKYYRFKLLPAAVVKQEALAELRDAFFVTIKNADDLLV